MTDKILVLKIKKEALQMSSIAVIMDKFKDLGIPLDLVYVLAALSLLYISTRVIKATVGHLIAIILIYYMLTYVQTVTKEDLVSFNEDMDYKLNVLGSPSYFHFDTNLINLFYSIYSWRTRNANNFDLAVKAVNNILRIESDSEKILQRCVDNYEIAYDQSRTVLNLIHGFVYNLDGQPILVKKLENVLSRLNELLERHLQTIQMNCEKQEKAKPTKDIHSRFIEDALGPKPFDGNKMSQFDFY